MCYVAFRILRLLHLALRPPDPLFLLPPPHTQKRRMALSPLNTNKKSRFTPATTVKGGRGSESLDLSPQQVCLLQCVAVCCSVLQCGSESLDLSPQQVCLLTLPLTLPFPLPLSLPCSLPPSPATAVKGGRGIWSLDLSPQQIFHFSLTNTLSLCHSRSLSLPPSPGTAVKGGRGNRSLDLSPQQMCHLSHTHPLSLSRSLSLLALPLPLPPSLACYCSEGGVW